MSKKLVDVLINLGDKGLNFPVLKSIKGLYEWATDISDIKEAYCQAIIDAYHVCFITALRLHRDLPQLQTVEVKDGQAIKSWRRYLADALDIHCRNLPEGQQYLYHVHAYNADDLPNNALIKYAAAYYFNDLLTNKLNLKDDRVNALLQKRIRTILTYTWLEVLERQAYTSLKAHLANTPAHEARRKVQALDTYEAYLKSLYEVEEIMGEPGLTLDQVYIEPHYGILKQCFKDAHRDFKGDFKAVENSLHQFISQWLQGSIEFAEDLCQPNARLMVILGHPGQGKSSFCKKLCADLLNPMTDEVNRRVWFIRLRDLLEVKDFVKKPYQQLPKELAYQVKSKTRVTTEINTIDFEDAIWVLDGLDELSMKDGLNERDIMDMLAELQKHAHANNAHCLVTSRYGRLTKEELRYKEGFLTLQLTELNVTQQKAWLNQYSTAKRAFDKECKPALTESQLDAFAAGEVDHIAELLNQPILLHMIAKLGIKLTEGMTRSTLYDQMFTTILTRQYDESRQLEAHENLKTVFKKTKVEQLREPMRRLAGEVAYQIFINEQEYVNKYQLAHAEGVQLNKLFRKNDNSSQTAFENLRTLMMSFYMREVPRTEDDRKTVEADDFEYALEFVHKSFQEYMCAEHYWVTLKRKLLAKEEDDYTIDDANSALKFCQGLMSHRMLTQEIVEYLEEIIAKDQRQDADTVAEVGERMHHLLPYLLKHDFLLQYNTKEKHPPAVQSRNAFYAWWQILMMAAPNANHVPEGELIKEQLFNYLRQGQYIQIFNLRHQCLEVSHFPFVQWGMWKLDHVILADSYIYGADFEGVRLTDAHLENAVLNRADLQSADMRGANMKNVRMTQANLIKSNLRNARLEFAALEEADLRGAVLINADLTNADLTKANLEKANLKLVILKEAELVEAKMEDAYLEKANLKGANLTDVSLVGADLPFANLEGANLRRANFMSTDLTGASLDGAYLEDANFTGAELDEEQREFIFENGGYIDD